MTDPASNPPGKLPELPRLKPGEVIRGERRAKLSAALAQHYNAGRTIRALAADVGQSYSRIHRLLAEAGVQFRTRGGGVTRRRRAAQRPELRPGRQG